ncbi:MAG: glycoside hydrolase family 27 protein, partial [Bacteroidaceae bacterium]|nr:glycoside hydrolase family 27 protein [Bacteroidaceae bacterium]
MIASILALWGQGCLAQDKPTMGWSSWNTFALNISEEIIKGQATAMRTQGFYKVGYNHINIDDGYFGGRDPETGKLLIHPTRFPNGLKPVVDYIHTLKMKAGIYSDGGKNTCGNYHGGDKIAEGVGFYGHDQQDADLFFKELNFDFIKVDFCGGVGYHNSENLYLDEQERYTAIAKAIANTGRTDVRMNVCRWDYPGNWVHDVAASWRTTGDINASWGS